MLFTGNFLDSRLVKEKKKKRKPVPNRYTQLVQVQSSLAKEKEKEKPVPNRYTQLVQA